jgi:hypothetical protein
MISSVAETWHVDGMWQGLADAGSSLVASRLHWARDAAPVEYSLLFNCNQCEVEEVLHIALKWREYFPDALTTALWRRVAADMPPHLPLRALKIFHEFKHTLVTDSNPAKLQLILQPG